MSPQPELGVACIHGDDPSGVHAASVSIVGVPPVVPKNTAPPAPPASTQLCALMSSDHVMSPEGPKRITAGGFPDSVVD